MPVSSQQQGTTPAPPTTGPSATPAAPVQQAEGNDAVQQRMSASPGRLNWTAALGETLGGRLYDALAPQLTDDRLLGHANRLVDQALESVRGYLQGSVTPSDEDLVAAIMRELDPAMRAVARQAVVDSGLTDEIRDAVDDNPELVALAAVAGAVAYVLSNQDIPLLEQRLGLGGGHSLLVGVDPGRTLALALEQVRVGYVFNGDRLAARLTADVFQDGWSAAAEATAQLGEGESVTVSGSHTDRAGQQTSQADLRYQNPDLTAGVGWQYSQGTDRPGHSLTGSVTQRGQAGDILGRVSGNWHDDGAWNVGAGVQQQRGAMSWGAEVYGGQAIGGATDAGVRATFQLRF